MPKRLSDVQQTLIWLGLVMSLLRLLMPDSVMAQESASISLGLSPIGYEYRGEADFDDGGHLEQHRAFGGLQLRLQPSGRWDIALNSSYTYHRFRFDGNSGLGSLDPWEHVNLLSFSAPITLQASEHWQVSLTPFLQINMESDADVSQSIIGGGILSVVYEFSPRFRLGLGIGAESRLEDDGTLYLFPFLEWHISDAVRLVSQVREPFPVYTLELQVDLSPVWSASLGIDAREDRFRLDDEGTAPDGVGESNRATLRVSLAYQFQPGIRLSAYGGVGVGEIRLEDNRGHKVREDELDPAPVFGLVFTASF